MNKNNLLAMLIVLWLSISMLYYSIKTTRQYQIQRHREELSPTARSEWNDELDCLQHSSIEIEEKWGKATLEHQSASKCGRLRRNWLSMPPLSEYAKKIEAHQSNCSIPLATHHFSNIYGFGSHMVLWGQSMCNAMEMQYRMRSHAPEWIFNDQEHCDKQQAALSPLLCYFPASENKCSDQIQEFATLPNLPDPTKKRKWCALTKDEESLKIVRAASTEYLFQRISPLVISEAKRQIGIIFPDGVVPEDLVTVHVRWGDKWGEMDLVPIEEYIDAVHAVLAGRTSLDNTTMATIEKASTANIYLATEDPKAYEAFMKAKPDGWNVYADITLVEIDAFRPLQFNGASRAASRTKGRAGLIAVASVLVGLEANMFVLTTKSTWSAVMDHLRTNIVDPRCNNCTRSVDLRPYVWDGPNTRQHKKKYEENRKKHGK